MLSILKEELGNSNKKSLTFNDLLFASIFKRNFFKEKPDCSVKLSRLIAAFNESFFNAFKEMVAAKFSTSIWEALNLPGVSGSDNTSYLILPRRISTELIRKSRFVSSFNVSLGAKASNTN